MDDTVEILAALFQFPPLREGRRGLGAKDMPSIVISIPAPARGATSWKQALSFVP